MIKSDFSKVQNLQKLDNDKLHILLDLALDHGACYSLFEILKAKNFVRKVDEYGKGKILDPAINIVLEDYHKKEEPKEEEPRGKFSQSDNIPAEWRKELEGLNSFPFLSFSVLTSQIIFRNSYFKGK